MVIAMVNEEQIRISPNAAKEIQENSETLEGAEPSPAPTSSQADKSGEGTSDMEKEKQKQEYNAYIKQMAPSKNLFWQMCKAFLVGGLFCVLGQFILNTCKAMGLEKETAGSWTSLLLILLSVILTGFHLYQCIAAWAGAGALVPITGFANSVASPAIEYKTEGQVFGIGVKIFTIAGPVILYGVFTSWLLGVFYWLGIVLGLV